MQIHFSEIKISDSVCYTIELLGFLHQVQVPGILIKHCPHTVFLMLVFYCEYVHQLQASLANVSSCMCLF